MRGRCAEHFQAAIFPHLSHHGDVEDVVDHHRTDQSDHGRQQISLHIAAKIELNGLKIVGAEKGSLLRDAHLPEKGVDIGPQLLHIAGLLLNKTKPQFIWVFGMACKCKGSGFREPAGELPADVFLFQNTGDRVSGFALSQIQRDGPARLGRQLEVLQKSALDAKFRVRLRIGAGYLAGFHQVDHPRIHESKRQIAVPVADSGTVNGVSPFFKFAGIGQLPDLFQRTDAAGLIVSLNIFSCLHLSGGLDKTQHSHKTDGKRDRKNDKKAPTPVSLHTAACQPPDHFSRIVFKC